LLNVIVTYHNLHSKLPRSLTRASLDLCTLMIKTWKTVCLDSLSQPLSRARSQMARVSSARDWRVRSSYPLKS
jgi:hypothetical protein